MVEPKVLVIALFDGVNIVTLESREAWRCSGQALLGSS